MIAKIFYRIAVSFTLAFLVSIPLSVIVVRLGGYYGYIEFVQRTPLLTLGAYWLLGRLPFFRKQ